jgi:hypothetical protein
MTLALTVDWASLLEAAYVSAAFGIGIMLVGALAVIASLRAQDRQAAHQHGVVAYNLVTAVCVLAILAAVVLGIYVMTQK